MPIRLAAVLTGRAVPFGRPGAVSAIAKTPAAGPVAIGPLGLAGDEQGDPLRHGGPDKAVHHYPLDHYAAWARELPAAAAALLAAPGAFGENLSAEGLTEGDVCFGDVWQAGTARLQVSQTRQPCWKLDIRFGLKGMARRLQASGRTGWYYRVLEPGSVRAGDALALADRPHPDWPLARILNLLYVDTLDRPALSALLELPGLVPSWRKLAAARLESGTVEDWRPRLDG
ncbi:MAG TPA: MOSC domain-containing protein [Alphaproteobacteria bacterium]|nr:MOSC domain-containing protein [Alphaproteobacteria bacterium]